MRKIILTCLTFLFLSQFALATKHIIKVSNTQFNPSTINNVVVGDIIRWEWVNGFHTTTCDPENEPGTSLPAGATPWNETMSSGSPVYEYTVTVAGTYNYICIPHASMGMKGSFVASAVLPVKISLFQLTGTADKVTLNWNTATEQNTAYFSVRRSANGSDFQEIAKVDAVGNSTKEQSYSFADSKISSKQKYYYYNLAIVDKDGKQVFSETKMYRNTKADSKIVLSLSPNPITAPGHLRLSFNAEKEGQMDVKIINAEGKTVVTSKLQAYAGVNSGHVHLGNQAAGTYTMVVTINGVTESHQILYK